VWWRNGVYGLQAICGSSGSMDCDAGRWRRVSLKGMVRQANEFLHCAHIFPAHADLYPVSTMHDPTKDQS